MHPIGSERGFGDGGRRHEAVTASGDPVLGTDGSETAVTNAAGSATEWLDRTSWVGAVDAPLQPNGYRSGAGADEHAGDDGDSPTGYVRRVPPDSLFFPGVEASTYPGAGDQDE